MEGDSQGAYRNNNLFSKYYIENYLPKSPEWGGNDHIKAFDLIKEICNRESKFLHTYNEKQLENHFFNDIFDVLGFEYEVTEPTEARNFPDYAFFVDRKSLEDAHKKKDAISFFTNAIAIGEVKQWKVDLDKITKNEYSISENPSLQIRTYLDDTKQKWGILTNGRYWRLYCKDKRRDDYLEVDLPFLILSNDIEAFRFFYYFFRKDAFISSQEGPAFLDRILKESFEYATEIGDSLKENVYWAMKRISEGFIERSSNNLDRNNPAILSLVQKNSMLLLYRFLFLLYAEGKGLLDLNNPQYLNNFSFHCLKHNISTIQDGPIEKRYTSIKCSLLSELKELFKLVNQGSESFGIPKEEFFIPAYNGGLFDPNKHPELERWEIGDQYLADAIDLLSRSNLKDQHRDFVDYSTLEIRHLGSIYEGLLEYKLRVAESDLVVSDGGWVTLNEYNAKRKQKKAFTDFDESNRVNAGHLYLATDKGERKSTGSYYTPDYIVNYIIENTIGPTVEQKWRDSQILKTSYITGTLSINVLDPAMGSGHFLVGAVDFLAQKLLEAVQKDHETGLITNTAPFTNDWARREVVSHCIYGVDLNELAVELAKVGLWLTTINKDKPLSFLDHRLKQGNSLIGASLTKLRYYPGTEPKEMNQTELPTSISPRFIGHLLSKIAEIDAIEENQLVDVKNKERVFNEFKQLPEYQRAKGLANVYISTYFGNTITATEKKSSEAQYQDLVWAIAGNEGEWQYKTRPVWFKQACNIAKEKSFFHWELEYPEIFFDAGKLRDNPGWDAIIGNPPYANAWAMTDLDNLTRASIASLSPRKDFLSGHWDLYIPFVAIATQFLKSEGFHSFILPDAMAKEKYAISLRKSMITDYSLIRWTHFEDENVFDNVSRHCVIYVLKKTFPNEGTEVICDNPPHQNETSSLLFKVPLSKWLVGPNMQFRPKSVGCGSDKIIEMIESKSIRLGQYCYVMVGATLHSKDKVSFKKNDVVSHYPTGNAKAFFDGKTLFRYEIKFDNRFLDYKQDLMYGPRVPELFDKPKIVIRKVTEKNEGLVVAYDQDGLYCDDRIICVTPYQNIEGTGAQTEFEGYPHLKGDIPGLSYTLGLLASSLITWYFKAVFATGTLQGSYSDTYPKQVRAFPIRYIRSNTPIERRSDLLNKSKELFQGSIIDSASIIEFVESRLTADLEESDVIHDLIGFLAEQMVQMFKDKNEEINKFLKFLENEIGTSIDVLSNKTVIKEYYNYDFNNLVEVLTKNRNKLKNGYSPKNRTNYENLQGWYNSSVGKLNPLLQRINATDSLIDKIVYKLYGLNEEEIKIIEDRM
ncbi:MAG: hypothetical protein BWY93_00788 [Euryarchaeota archaeon ADurb.BinA087]|nr:MAG: hypothetical protein BWY93_00788 [Euryarchaeota archaeon ADurb.BinA087]